MIRTMCPEGFRTVSVSEEVFKKLREKAESYGLSLNKLIERYVNILGSDDIVKLQTVFHYLDSPTGIAQRIHYISTEISQSVITAKHKERNKKLRLAGEDPREIPVPYDEIQAWTQEANDLAKEIAPIVIEYDRETYTNLKKALYERNLKAFVSEYLQNIVRDEKRLLSELETLKAKLNRPLLITDYTHLLTLICTWSEYQKYIPYCPPEVQDLNAKIEGLLTEAGAKPHA